jgi:hypothetical protein
MNVDVIAAFLKLKMGLSLTPKEERSLKGATDPSAVIDDLRKLTRAQITPH